MAVLLLAVSVASMALFATFGALAYEQGKDMARILDSELDSKAATMVSVHSDAEALQAVINGTQPVAGAFIASAFEPDPPRLATYSQVCNILLCNDHLHQVI